MASTPVDIRVISRPIESLMQEQEHDLARRRHETPFEQIDDFYSFGKLAFLSRRSRLYDHASRDGGEDKQQL